MNGKVHYNVRLLVSVLLLVLAGKAEAVTHYVSQGQSIQKAIDDANDGDEIEVSPGTYNEAINFKGKAIRLYSSGWSAATTIDATGLNTSVVTCNSGEDANTILEGFTITGGSNQYGGGIYNYYSNLTVTNCILTNNSALSGGGGMRNDNSSPMLSNCTFIGNTASYGGGMANKNSSPTITNCIFSGNSANSYGGMSNADGSPTITKCTFTGNTAIQYGGGMGNDGGSATVSNCIFSNNSAGDYGGGMENFMSGLKMTNCTFIGNSAPHGGSLVNYNSGSMKVTNCIFMGNEASIRGGGMLNIDSNLTVTNCTFSGNSSQKGGGMNNNASDPTVTNCIIWGNTTDEIYNQYSSPSVTYSDVQGGWPGLGNEDADPLFVSAAEGDLRLSSSASPCIDAGNNSAPALPATDVAGNPRIVDGDRNGTATVDMGAYEFQPGLIHNITNDLWYETIQAGIGDAEDGDEIEVAPGTYNEAINFKGKAVRLYSSGGPEVTIIDANGIAGAYHVAQCVSDEGPDTILEGFTITGGNANGFVYPDDIGGGMYNNNSDPTVTKCIFTGNTARYGGSGMYNYDYSSPKVTNCVFIGNTTTGIGGGMGNEYGSHTSITDCNFINNTANGGGGMYNYRSNPSVNNCTFSDNTADYGGGVLNEISGPMVINCTLSGNEASEGGGILNEGSESTVTNCTFNGNTADYFGGGMYNHDSEPKVTNCKFSNNESNYGGGMHNSTGSDSTVINCTFRGNTASDAGGGMYNNDSQPTLINCTLTTNTALTGGGMFNRRCWPILTNCILWGDIPNEIIEVEFSSRIYYCDIEGGWSGAGSNNIDADPCFVNAAGGDLRLSSFMSPCVDAGDSTLLLAEGIYLDLDGKIRYVDIESIVDTGSGPLEFLDMGAYEFNCNYTSGDINCDGVVDFKDLAILCNNWLSGAGT